MKKAAKRIIQYSMAALVLAGGSVLLKHAVSASVPKETPEPEDPFHVANDTISLSAATAKVAGIELTQLEPTTMPSTLTLSGRTDLDSERVTHVRAQFPGKVVDVKPQLGDAVLGPKDSGGPSPLCTIASTDLAQAKANYLQAQVQLKLDEDALTRTRELLKKQILADKYLLDAQSAVTKDTAVYDAARQQLLVFGLSDKDIEAIPQQIGKQRMTYMISSPRSGMIVEKGVVGGELADPTLNLFTVADTSKLWVWGDAYERDRARLREGQKIRVVLTSDPEHPRESTVQWISPVIDANTRSIKIRGSLDNADRKLLSQMYATLVVTVSDGKNSLVVPATSVVRKGPQAFVLVREGTGSDLMSFRRTAVKVEPIDAGPGLEATPPADPNQLSNGSGSHQQLRVSDGISPGQWIVARGALGLFNEIEQHQNSRQEIQSQPTQMSKG